MINFKLLLSLLVFHGIELLQHNDKNCLDVKKEEKKKKFFKKAKSASFIIMFLFLHNRTTSFFSAGYICPVPRNVANTAFWLFLTTASMTLNGRSVQSSYSW